MTLTKGQVLIYLYVCLKKGLLVNKKQTMKRFKLTEITLKRYVGKLRDYFAVYEPNFKIKYGRKSSSYFLAQE